jgi:hypothetical protein
MGTLRTAAVAASGLVAAGAGSADANAARPVTGPTFIQQAATGR